MNTGGPWSQHSAIHISTVCSSWQLYWKKRDSCLSSVWATMNHTFNRASLAAPGPLPRWAPHSCEDALGHQPVLLCLVLRHPDLPEPGNTALLSLPTAWQTKTGRQCPAPADCLHAHGPLTAHCPHPERDQHQLHLKAAALKVVPKLTFKQ